MSFPDSSREAAADPAFTTSGTFKLNRTRHDRQGRSRRYSSRCRVSRWASAPTASLTAGPCKDQRPSWQIAASAFWPPFHQPRRQGMVPHGNAHAGRDRGLFGAPPDKNSPGGGNHEPPPDAPRRCGLAAALFVGRRAVRSAGAGAKRRADQDRFQHGADRSAGAERQAGAARRQDLGRGNQRQRRAARPQGRAGQLRRPVQPRERARHLHQAARRRQSRPSSCGYATNMVAPAMPVVMQKGKTLRRLVRARRQQRVPLPEIFLDAADRSRSREKSFTEGFFQVAAAQNPKPKTVALVVRGRRVLAQRLRRRPQQRQDLRLQDRLRQDLPAGHDRLLADHPRAAGRQRRSSWWSAPIR